MQRIVFAFFFSQRSDQWNGSSDVLTHSYTSEGSPVSSPQCSDIFNSKLSFANYVPYFLTTSFICILWWHMLEKNSRSGIGPEIRPQSVFTGFRDLLLSENYSAEWSGRVWQPSADSYSRWRKFLGITVRIGLWSSAGHYFVFQWAGHPFCMNGYSFYREKSKNKWYLHLVIVRANVM